MAYLCTGTVDNPQLEGRRPYQSMHTPMKKNWRKVPNQIGVVWDGDFSTIVPTSFMIAQVIGH